MLSITQLKPGVVIVYRDAPHQVMWSEFSRSSQSGGFMRTKIKNLVSGNVFDVTFKEKEKLPEAAVEKQPAQFLYKAGKKFVFMNNQTYEQLEIDQNLIGEPIQFLREGMEVEIQYFNDLPINVELPIKVVLEIKETEPGYKGDTANAVRKPATLESGAVVKVPIFINIGDKIRVDTRTGEYLERA